MSFQSKNSSRYQTVQRVSATRSSFDKEVIQAMGHCPAGSLSIAST